MTESRRPTMTEGLMKMIMENFKVTSFEWIRFFFGLDGYKSQKSLKSFFSTSVRLALSVEAKEGSTECNE